MEQRMKQFGVLACVVLILAMMTIQAQDKTPVISFDNTSKDFGKVTEGQLLKHIFRFTNKGSVQLEILKVESSWGCTAALLSAKQIAPGQAGEIEVSVKTEGISVVNKAVTVTTNDPRQQRIVLTLRAVIEPEFQLSERSVYFGNVPSGQGVTREVTVTIPPGKSASLTNVSSTDQYVSAKLEAVPNSNGKQYTITVIQQPDAKEGYHFGMIIVKTTSSLTPEIKIPVRGIVGPPPKK
jgi:hypothetical protein